MTTDDQDDQDNQDQRGERRPITIEEAERMHTPTREDPARVKKFPQLALPFGFNNGQWESLKAQMQPGDELWWFSTSAQTWKDLRGRAGIELVRHGKPIAVIITLMN